MKKWLKRLAIAAALLGLVLLLVLEAVRYFGRRAGVEEVPLPAGSRIETLAAGHDYADAYRVSVPGPPRSLAGVAGVGPNDPVLFRGPDEVVFEGRAPGLRFLLSYHLESGRSPNELTVSTVVFYESLLGLVYFTPVKIGHRRLLPLFVARAADELAERGESG